MTPNTRTGYMCAVDFRWHIGEDKHPSPIYASVEDLKRQRKCWKTCGIVEVEVKLVEWAEPENFSSEK